VSTGCGRIDKAVALAHYAAMKELKTGIILYAKILWVFSFVVLTVPFLSAFAQLSALAQSGRDIPGPQSKPTPSPEASPNQGQAKRSFVSDRNTDTYKLVFPVSPGLDSFGEQLNKGGEQGYKLTSVIYRWQSKSASAKHEYPIPVGILKLDEVQHEYAWFETASTSLVAIDGFEQKYRELSQRGFRLVDLLLTSSSCDDGNPLGIVLGGGCDIDHLFLLERQLGVERPKQFILVRSPPRPGLKNKRDAELTAQIKERLVDGFYPTAVFSAWEILLTHAENSDDLTDNPDVQVVTSFDVRGRVNDLAKQGYRLVLINKRAAVMYRHGQTVTPLTYISLKVRDKHFGEQLAKLQESGAIYRTTYTGDSGVKDQLMFEQGPVADGRRHEYKVLNFEFQVVEDLKLRSGGEKEVHIDLTTSSKETMKQLNKLATEGFVVRDLFVSDIVSDRVSVLLERFR
jgi:polyglycine hydrolase-like protein